MNTQGQKMQLSQVQKGLPIVNLVQMSKFVAFILFVFCVSGTWREASRARNVTGPSAPHHAFH